MVDDAVSETFLVVWRRLDEVPAEPLPWLLAVARRVIATQHRSARRGVALNDKLAKDASLARGGDPDVSSEGGPVTDALIHLHPLDREAITLVAWDGLTPRQGAAALGQTRVAFRLRVYRAKRRIRAELERRTGSIPSAEQTTRGAPTGQHGDSSTTHNLKDQPQ